MDVQIIALDIDGTLTDDQKNISNITLEALIEAEKKGNTSCPCICSSGFWAFQH